MSEPHEVLLTEAAPERLSPGPSAGIARLFADSRFRRFWLGQAVSELGDGMTGLALLVLVDRLAGTVSAIAALSILTMIPQVALGLHAGVFVDRWDRRRVMIASDLLRGTLVAGLILLREPGQLAWVYALAIGQAAAGVFFEPARSAFLPALLAPDTLLAANSLGQTTRVVSMTAGAAVAGLLLGLPHGTALVFGLDALSFVFSAAALWSIRVRARASHGTAPTEPGAEGSARPGVLMEMRSGLRILFGNRILVGLLLTFAITLLGSSAVGVLFVPFMLHDLRASTGAIGLARAAQTLGMVAGGALLAGPGSRIPPVTVLGLGMLALGPLLAMLGLAPSWPALLPMLALVGVCSSALQAGTATLLQHAVPAHARGRAESTLDTLLVVVMLIAMAAAGAAGDRFGARLVFFAAGAFALAGGLVGRAWLSPRAAAERLSP